MKSLITICVIIFPTFFAICQNKESLFEVARFENKKVKFTIDTTAFKNEIKQMLVTNAAEVIFDKIQILKQPIIGRVNDSVYYIHINSHNKKATFSRVLTKIDQTFYFDNSLILSSSFNLIYLMCQRKENFSDPCDPNVFDIEGKLTWICGTDPKCVLPGFELSCKSFTSIIFPE